MNRIARLVLGGWGRRAAWTMLAVFLLLQVFVPSLFDAARLGLFDSYQRPIPRKDIDRTVVIVTVDNASLAAIGQWPWPRQIQAALFARILSGQPAALGIDMIWPEPDQQSPEQWIQYAGMLQPALLEELKKLPRHDAELADVLQNQPVAIGFIGMEAGPSPDIGKLAPFRTTGLHSLEIPDGILPNFTSAVRSIPELDDAALGHGFLSVNPDSDGTFRRLPMVSRVAGRPAPTWPWKCCGLPTESRRSEYFFSRNAVKTVAAGQFAIPTQRDGSIWIHFSYPDARRFVSAEEILSGKISPSLFKQKLVLVGLTGEALLDLRPTPVGPMPGVEIQAQLLENLHEGEVARRPDWTMFTEPALTFLIALFLIVSLPLLRPRWQAGLGLLVFAGLAGLGFGLWQQDRILLDVATPAIGQALIVIAYMSAGFAQADMQRRRLRQELEQRKLAAARTEGELEAARRIQMGILPDPKALGGDPRFELDALMIPARQIGGDLFDFFKLDDGRLFFSVGDVSGKGVPAALFMALGKSLCKSIALSGQAGIGAILDRANSEISRENPEMLFITIFAGILDLDSGMLDFCSAGHDAPFLLRAGEKPQAVDSTGGPPLCVVDDFSYPAERFALKPGDLFCVITDGITEAMTADGAVMGRAKASDVLAALPPNLPPGAVIKALHDAVDAYVAGAEPSDDLTILAVRWRGPTAQ